jgi:hypothetical protein
MNPTSQPTVIRMRERRLPNRRRVLTIIEVIADEPSTRVYSTGARRLDRIEGRNEWNASQVPSFRSRLASPAARRARLVSGSIAMILPVDSRRMNLDRRDILPAGALLVLGSLAFVHLAKLPMFEDEGSQLRLIWRIIEHGEWLQPLGDGKPLEAWLMVPLVATGVTPILATRALHVIAGMISAVLTWRLALRVSDRTTALVCGLLFAICPFEVYLQRLALSETFLCAAGAGVLLSLAALCESPTAGRAAALGVALVLAALAKMPVGFVFLISAPLALVLLPRRELRGLRAERLLEKLAAAHAPVIVLGILVIVVASIRLRQGKSPGFGIADLIGVGLGGYTFGTSALHRPTLMGELTAQLSWPVTVLSASGLVASVLWGDWRQRWLIAVGLLPMLAIGLGAEFWYGRYLLFTLVPLIIAAVCGWRSLALRANRLRRPIEIGALVLSAALLGRQSASLILDPAGARWSPLDRYQYFEGPGSGYGYPDAARFILGTPGAPRMIYALDGHSAYQLRNYLPPAWSSRVSPVYYDGNGPVLHSETERLDNLLNHSPAWIVIPAQLLNRYLDSTFGSRNRDRIVLRRVEEFRKPGSLVQLGLYEVTRRH